MRRETTSRSKSEFLTSDSVVCTVQSTESEVRSADFDRKVVSRPTFVLPFGCPKPPLKWVPRKLNQEGYSQSAVSLLRSHIAYRRGPDVNIAIWEL